MIVTREIINKNIIFNDYISDGQNGIIAHTYTFNDLSKSIDSVKNYLLANYKIKPNDTILIGVRTASRMQLAIVFAALELGISLCIVDYDRKDDFIDYNYIDPKTKILLPINFHIVENKEHTKFKIFENICENTIILSEVVLNDFTENKIIYATEESVILKCTSSGTTGTPKLIYHTHNFLYHLIKRNSAYFDGNTGFIFNLNHGSSPATYFFPVLASQNVSSVNNFNYMILNNVIDNIHLDHLMIPYTYQIENLLKEKSSKSNNLQLYTLSTIKKEWLKYLKNQTIKDIISYFGSNETSGPVLINRLSSKNFYESKFYKLDNFYELIINDQEEIIVKMPIYQSYIKTNDKFKLHNNYFYHLGRNDLIRINGRNVDLFEYDKFLQSKLQGNLVYDTVFNEIYLAVWEDNVDTVRKIKEVNTFIKQKSYNTHFISKAKVLSQDHFLTGVKIDHELLRDYFRNYIKSNLQ